MFETFREDSNAVPDDSNRWRIRVVSCRNSSPLQSWHEMPSALCICRGKRNGILSWQLTMAGAQYLNNCICVPCVDDSALLFSLCNQWLSFASWHYPFPLNGFLSIHVAIIQIIVEATVAVVLK